MNNKYIDYSGQRFGRLLVVKRVDTPENVKKDRARTYFLCRCDCGNEKIINSYSFSSGKTTSCGCYNKEVISLPFGEASLNKVFIDYKSNSRKRNMAFELSKEYFTELIQNPCFYCGKPPSNTTNFKRNNGDYTYNGIDRVDSNKGYTIENTVPCCYICNQAKMSETQSDFFEWIKTVHSNLSIKGLI